MEQKYLMKVTQELSWETSIHFDDSYFLCGFCDASILPYAAIVYLVTVREEDVHISFVTAKTRVAPLQSQTIPRLELLSALLLSRLITTVADSLISHSSN